MRILALVPEAFGGFGGIAVYNRDILTALADLPGCTRITVLPRLVRSSPGELPPKIELRAQSANSLARYVGELVRLLLSGESYDFVMCGHINLLPLSEVARQRLRASQVLLVYGIDAWKPTGRRLSDRLASRADAVISISQFTKQRFLSWAILPPERVHLLPNAVHLEHYGIGGKPRYLEERYGLEGKKVLMTLARLSSLEGQKGIDEMLQTVADLVRENIDLCYLVAGDGDDRARLQAKAHALGIGAFVKFTGLVSEAEKADHFRLADAFVMPGRQEGFGFVFLEAMACGIPVVASALDGSREAVLYGKIGDLANPDDGENLKAAIRRALLRPRSVPEGLAYFSYDRFCDRLQAIMAGLMVERPCAT